MTAKQEHAVKKTLYKSWRELSKLNNLLKHYKLEQEAEQKAQEMFCYAEGIAGDTNWHGFNVINIKSIKIMFNRAYRIKYTDSKRAIELYKDIIV